MNARLWLFITLIPGITAGCALRVPKPDGDGRAMVLKIKGNTREELEKELASLRSSRVVISTQDLRALLMNDRLAQSQCKDIKGKLEAIKSVDLKETEAIK